MISSLFKKLLAPGRTSPTRPPAPMLAPNDARLPSLLALQDLVSERLVAQDNLMRIDYQILIELEKLGLPCQEG